MEVEDDYYAVGFDCSSNSKERKFWQNHMISFNDGVAFGIDAIRQFRKMCRDHNKENQKIANERYPVGKGFGYALFCHTLTTYGDWDDPETEDGEELQDTEEVGIIAEKRWIHRSN